MSVLVATNATPEGEAALRAAVTEAERRGVKLLWCNLASGAVPHLADVLAGREATEIVRDPNQDPADAVLDAVVQENVELLVVGVKRRSPVGKVLLGSVAQQLILDSTVPVLAVKAN